MKRWMNALGRYKGSVILFIIFLIVEALCDITLPGYTSKMIDTGIQNSGIEHVAPEKITKEEYEYAQLFMDDEEKQLWDNSYTENGDIYELKSLSKKELDNLDDKLSGALIMNNQISSVDESTFEKMMNQGDSQTKITPEMLGIKEFPADLRPIIINMVQAGRMNSDNLISMKNELNSKLDEIGATIKNSMGIAYAKKMDKMAGVDVDAVQQRFLWTNGGIMIVIAAIMAVAMIIDALLAAKVGAAIGRDLREQTYENVMKFSNSEIEKFSTASLITRTTNDIQQIQQSTTLVLRMALYSPILAAAGIVQVILTGSGMGWIIGLAVALIFGVLAILMGLAVPKFKSVQKLIDNVNRISREILTGMLVIRAFNREKKEEVRFEKSNKDLFKTQLFIGKIMSFLMPILMFIMFGMSVLIIWVGGHKIDEGTLQIGQMTSFITYSMLIVMSFLMLTMLALIVPRAMVAADRIDEVITTESSIKNADNAVELNNPKGVVEFKNVNFAYDGAEGDIVLKDISFKAEPGKTTAIIGSTGCGKTTLIQLIPRLYDVTDGEITIDGINVKDIDIKSLRKAIGYVPQKRILFSGTIATNIAYGNDDATMEDIEKAAKIAQAEEFIESKEDKYDSPISQGGTNVSGGQNQRLQIARALAKHPKILLFDDSFSALDMKTDKLLRETLSKEVKDATLIIVAQRVGTIINADQIIVLDEGSIVGMGTHEELLKNCETYREIAESQLSKEELYGKEVAE
ncbi:MAG: ABC transporter ATP-binding protein [Lachnospiraceae bacterium]|nr:ABC transporter ATP-binding protein/permease [Lachnospiraceae bacterium]MDY2956818.1 ABC transporter ATP-binding protein [Lachnospiraceae bacterium]